MKRFTLEFSVGLFVIMGILCTIYLSLRLGELDLFATNQYLLTAKFENISGLVINARIEISGVQVGKVNNIALDQNDGVAVVSLLIDSHIKVDEDTIASVKTSGLIGAKYIKLSLGGSDTLLASGDEIQETESVVDIEELISKYVFEGNKP